MTMWPKGIEIKIREGDSEIDRKVIGMGFEILGIGRVIIGNAVRTDVCLYDKSALEKMWNLKDVAWRACYRCPECNRRYLQEVSYEEKSNMKQGRKIKYTKKKEIKPNKEQTRAMLSRVQGGFLKEGL